MALTDWLMPNEQITYTSPGNVNYNGAIYQVCLSDSRLLLYRKSGFFSKESIIAERLPDILSMEYAERGLIEKHGVLTINTGSRKLAFVGMCKTIKSIWQTLQPLINIV